MGLRDLGTYLETGLDRLLGYPFERRRFKRDVGYWPSLLRPRSYNEKLVWRKLYDRNPLLARVTDKWRVRGYVAERLGGEQAAQYLIPVRAVYESVDQIRAEDLSAPCVIKPTHSSGKVLLLPHGLDRGIEAVRAECAPWLRGLPYRLRHHEWAYRHLTPRLVVESYLGAERGCPPPDYKFLIFHGRTAVVQLHCGRFGEYKRQEFCRDWTPVHETRDLPEDELAAMPENYARMVEVAETLAGPFDFIRVDMYNIDGHLYIGELTCYPASGRRWFQSFEHDFALGAAWQLPPRLPAMFPSRYQSHPAPKKHFAAGS